jgi:hypothetical protein
MAKCLPVRKFCQHAEAKLDYTWLWTREFSRLWQRDEPYDLGVTVRPNTNPVTGYQYISSGGQSGEIEPNWPRVAGAEIVDGSITWTTEAIATNSLEEMIASDLWTVSDSPGLTLEPQAPTVLAGKQATRAIMSGGLSGVTYVVENEVFSSEGLEYVARLLLTIE